MIASVTELRPAQGSIDQALASYRAAELNRCLSETNGLTSIAAISLRARCYLRLGAPDRALRAAKQIEVYSYRDRAEIELLSAVAQQRLGEDCAAEDSFLEARTLSISASNPALEAETHFYLALRAFGAGNFSGASADCKRALEAAHAVSLFRPVPESGVIPLAHVIARVEELLGLIASATSRYRDHIRYARATLATLDSSDVQDVYQMAFAIKNMAILARDFDLSENTRLLADRAAALPWTADIARPRFVIAQALGWCAALRGESVEAFGYFREASSVATTIPEQVLIASDRAVLARSLGAYPIAREEIDHALDLSRGFAWDTAIDDHQLYLLPFAQAVATIYPARARELLAKYRRTSGAIDTSFAGRHELRIQAELAYTDGVVLRAEGQEAQSAETLLKAFDIWDSIGYSWRASRAAVELAELPNGSRFVPVLRAELHARPTSVFASRARAIAA